MAEPQSKTSGDCWPTKREAFNLGLTLGHALATAEFHKMQKPSGDGTMSSLVNSIKVWAERYELLSKLWAMRGRLSFVILIAGWWDYLLLLLRFITG